MARSRTLRAKGISFLIIPVACFFFLAAGFLIVLTPDHDQRASYYANAGNIYAEKAREYPAHSENFYVLTEAAQKSYLKALRLGYDDAQTWQAISWTYAGLKDHDKALQAQQMAHFLEGRELSDQNPDMFLSEIIPAAGFE